MSIPIAPLALSIPLIPLALYVAIGGAYLVVLPAFAFLYLRSRWYVASSIERLLMYFMVFLFFPGLLLLSPVLNFRPQPRQMG